MDNLEQFTNYYKSLPPIMAIQHPIYWEILKQMSKSTKPVQPTLQATEGTVTAMTVIHKDIMGKELLYLVLHKNDGKDREVVSIGASTFERISKLLIK